MSSIHPSNVSEKPVEVIHPSNFPKESQDPALSAKALQTLVENSSKHDNVQHGIHAPMYKLLSLPLVKDLIPGLEKIATDYHIGNFVVMRGTGEKFFESMPLYPRLGMHLLFYGGTQVKIMHQKTVEAVLKDLSIHQGKAYDSPESVKSIPSFIDTYSIQLDDLLEPNIKAYNTFNEFFYRRLKADARPVQNESDTTSLCSAADCRLTVYDSVSLAQKYWIKGSNFTIANLLNLPQDSEQVQAFDGGSVAIFRLAPSDYHRFHSPIDGSIGEISDVPGEYYTVNPQAVNEPGFDVLTANKRSVLYMKHIAGFPVAYVAIGAMLVGSVRWTGGKQKGTTVKRGDELGHFAYGGSTIVALFPKGAVRFDEDLLKNSQVPIETLMKVGYSLGKTLPPSSTDA